MSSQEHAVSQGHVSKNVQSGMQSADPVKRGEPRRGLAIDVNDASSLLSPILSHLPSLSTMPSLNGILPSSSSRPVDVAELSPSIISSWETADLGDGNGRCQLLLLSYPQHALQIYRFPTSVLSDDPHVKEHVYPPEEVCSIPKIDCGQSGRSQDDDSDERVLCARLLNERDWGEHGPTVVILMFSTFRNIANSISVVLVSLRSGAVLKRARLGASSSAALEVASGVVAVAVSQPSALIHILHAQTLEAICSPISDSAVTSATSLPVFALSGRLLAYAVSDPPTRPGPDGLGAVVSARSNLHSPAVDLAGRSHLNGSRSSESAQTALLSTAAEIGGGVAKGVWAGIRLGARAAKQARNARLARSAPVDAGVLADVEAEADGELESKSMEESSVLSTSFDHEKPSETGGEWFKVLDLRPFRTKEAVLNGQRGAKPLQQGTTDAPRVIAHCRCPPVLSVGSVASEPYSRLRQALSRSIGRLSFNKAGTQLLVAPNDGRNLHIFELQPSGLSGLVSSSTACQALHLYELRRGNTTGTVREISWADDGRWVGIGTGKGTIHVFPINPTGGPVSAPTHACIKNSNPQQLYPLSTVGVAAARLRPQRDGVASPGASRAFSDAATFTFPKVRRDPLRKGHFLQDVLVFRNIGGGQAEQSRLELRAARMLRDPAASASRTGSALTEMMRAKAGLVGASDLEVLKSTQARWSLPAGAGNEEGIIIVPKHPSRSLPKAQGSSLSQAEIQTYCPNLKILPGTIYLSRQVDFYAARPIDDFAPLSIMNLEARTKRLLFRPEVEARPTSPEVMSFDEPLLSALHTVIAATPASQIPGLPNGHPSPSRWPSIPIRSVAANLGEGVDRVRREYVRAQHSRARRRANEAAQNGLSFEDDTVLDIQGHGEEYDDGDSSPSSALQPATSTDSSVEDGDWGEGWDAEYAKAVEDEGGPEELVLGLMDEEEEERRAWMLKQKQQRRNEV